MRSLGLHVCLVTAGQLPRVSDLDLPSRPCKRSEEKVGSHCAKHTDPDTVETGKRKVPDPNRHVVPWRQISTYYTCLQLSCSLLPHFPGNEAPVLIGLPDGRWVLGAENKRCPFLESNPRRSA